MSNQINVIGLHRSNLCVCVINILQNDPARGVGAEYFISVQWILGSLFVSFSCIMGQKFWSLTDEHSAKTAK